MDQTIMESTNHDGVSEGGDEDGSPTRTSNSKMKLQISQHVLNTISEVLESKDPLDKPDFNPVDYINSLFPSEQSLCNLDDVLNRMKEKIRQLDEEIRTVVRGQNHAEIEGKKALEEAREIILELTSKICEIKDQAKKSEKMVDEITRDIKQLDNAKRNLTASIIMINNLHILVEGVEKLQDATKNRNYNLAASVLEGVTDVLNQFESHKHIPQISQLAAQVDEAKLQLATQIKHDFREAFEGPDVKSFTAQQLELLAEACLVVSVLDPKVKEDLQKWFVDLELTEYKAIFTENQEIAWLDKVDKRYAWLKKHLIEFEERLGRMFPPSWEMSEVITVEFCNHTRQQLTKVMQNRNMELNVQLLLFAINKTTFFENLLAQRFFGRSLPPERQQLANPFQGIISQAFEPHLNIYVEAQDRNLGKLLEQFAEELQKQQSQRRDADPAGAVTTADVFPSSGKLFTQYKNCLVQCVQLSNRQPLILLCNTFQKYLREYAQKILQPSLPRIGLAAIAGTIGGISGAGGSASVISAASSAAGLIQSLLKEATEGNRFKPPEIAQICSVLLTANYCLETTQQLEKKLQEKVDTSLAEKINMSVEMDLFHSTISNCIQLLVQDIEAGCESSFNSMVKTQWSKAVTPIGPSAYVSTLTAHLQQQFPFIRGCLQDSMKHFTQLCNRFAQNFIPKFINNLFKCKPLSQGAAEQLLLDTHTLKKVLLDLPCWESTVKTAPANYTKTVIKGMTKAEMILKIALVPHDRVDGFIESYQKLLSNSDTSEFQKILELKGVPKNETQFFVEAYKNRIVMNLRDPEQQVDSGQEQDQNGSLTSPAGAEYESSRVKKLENLIRKRL